MTNDELKVLVIEAGAIFDQIDDLPLNDDGTRELPPGMLDRGRYTERTQIYAKVLPCLRRRASGEAV